MLTEQQLEIAARILCRARNRDPDTLVWYWKGVAFAHSRGVWALVAEEIREHVEIEDALKQASKPAGEAS